MFAVQTAASSFFVNGCLFVTILTVLQWIHLLLHARRDYTCPSLCTQHLHTDSAFTQRSTKRWRSESKHRLHMQREWDKAWLRRPDGSETLLSLQQESSDQHERANPCFLLLFSYRIQDIIMSGPMNMTKHRTAHNEFVLRWTPFSSDLGDYFPVCFAVESATGLASVLFV